jgi:hypothetical protein
VVDHPVALHPPPAVRPLRAAPRPAVRHPQAVLPVVVRLRVRRVLPHQALRLVSGTAAPAPSATRAEDRFGTSTAKFGSRSRMSPRPGLAPLGRIREHTATSRKSTSTVATAGTGTRLTGRTSRSPRWPERRSPSTAISTTSGTSTTTPAQTPTHRSSAISPRLFISAGRINFNLLNQMGQLFCSTT